MGTSDGSQIGGVGFITAQPSPPPNRADAVPSHGFSDVGSRARDFPVSETNFRISVLMAGPC